MLFTLYYRDLIPTRAYSITQTELINRFKDWQTSKACTQVAIKNPTAKILFFIGCSKGMRSVMRQDTFKPIVNALKNYVA